MAGSLLATWILGLGSAVPTVDAEFRAIQASNAAAHATATSPAPADLRLRPVVAASLDD